MSAKNTSPWRGLPRLTRQQVALQQTALAYLAAPVLAQDFAARLAVRLGRALRAKAALGSAEVRVLGRDEALGLLPEVGYFAIVGAEPSVHKLLLDIDASLGAYAVERLLAGEAAEGGSHVLREPTDLELGVVTYLLTDALDLLVGELTDGRALALTVERMLGKAHAVMPFFGRPEAGSQGSDPDEQAEQSQHQAADGAERDGQPSPVAATEAGDPPAVESGTEGGDSKDGDTLSDGHGEAHKDSGEGRAKAATRRATARPQAGPDCIQLIFRLQLERKLGYLRLLLPKDFVTGFFGAQLKDASDSKAELARVRRCLAAMPELFCEARVIGAKIELSQQDLANLEVGDIIVLDEHKLALADAALTGGVTVRLGAGLNGGFAANITSSADDSQLEVTHIIVQHDVQGAGMADAEQAAPDNLPQTEGLLRDVDASVAVELGRLKLSAAQVVRLRQGQVLRLARKVTDPVALVVGGKLFARGELIEIDGELGVRLTHVTGDDT